MPQFDVRMRTTKVEIWTIEAETPDEAKRKAQSCVGIIDEREVDLEDWEALSVLKEATP